uniref:Uncharacterized protein n=1 Tax=Vitis vinifera TaxID=29760 RepID=F6GUY0_VITVI
MLRQPKFLFRKILLIIILIAWLGTTGTHPLFYLVEFICMPNTN